MFANLAVVVFGTLRINYVNVHCVTADLKGVARHSSFVFKRL